MEPIAVIGFSFKLPGGAEDESSLWAMLQEARNVMKEYPPERVNLDTFYSAEMSRNNTLYSKGAHFLEEDPAVFDAPFFMITKAEAASMDPQQRKLLEVAYHALENAGIPMHKAAGSDTGIFASTMANDFERLLAKDPETNTPTAIVGTSPTIVAGRLSWFFDFKGPCLHVDTACSSSLTAVDLACQSLRNGASTMALVAGANLILSPDVSLAESNMLFLSPDSQCKTFTSGANGYSRGEGIVALILKKVSNALADGDVIRAVIRGSGSNHDGRTPSIGRPSTEAQQKLIERVYQDAALDFSKTRYFEAHGTGTAIGDPTETKAIGRVFRSYRSPEEPLYIGSIKANIGHIEAGSGIASVVKAILVLEKGIIPPNALFDDLNPKIDAEFYNLKVPDKSVLWPSVGLRRVSINSFGFGGSNAHVILDDAGHFLEDHGLVGNHRTQMFSNISMNGHHINGNGNGKLKVETETPKLLLFSAKDEGALKRLIGSYEVCYHSSIQGDSQKLQDLAFTLASRRSRFAWRSFTLITPDCSLNQWQPEDIFRNNAMAESSRLGIAFVFTGQGAQYVGMGQQLMAYTIFASALEEIRDIYKDLGAEWDLLEEFFTENNIHDPKYSQPLCTALQIALLTLLKSWSIIPDTVIGHSSGEIAAAYAIGALTLKGACKVAYWRGKLASVFARSGLQSGTMLSVNLSENGALEYLSRYELRDTLTVACINSPSNVTISGGNTDIDRLSALLTQDGIQSFRVKTSAAYHSPAMLAIAEEYRSRLSEVNENAYVDALPARIVMVSSLTGKPVTSKELSSAQYWIDNLISPVRFSEAIQRLVEVQAKTSMKLGTPNIRTVYDIVEIGPHSALRRPIMECLSELKQRSDKPVRYHSILNRLRPTLITPLELPARLVTYGYPVDITAVNTPNLPQQRTPLLSDTPKYPFDKSQSYWSESRLSRDFRLRGGTPAHSILGVRVSDWNPLEPRWRKFITEAPLFPATGMIIMALSAAQADFDAQRATAHGGKRIKSFYVSEATFLAPIIVRSRIELQTQLRPKRNLSETSAIWSDVHIYTYSEADDGASGRWMECFRATIQTQFVSSKTEVDGGREFLHTATKARSDLEAARQKCIKRVSKDSFYSYHASHGLRYGPRFQLADDIRCHDDGTTVATVHNIMDDCPVGSFVHPATLDATFQTCMTSAWTKIFPGAAPTFVPHRLFDTYVSATGWTGNSDSHFEVMTTSKMQGVGKGATCRVMVLNSNGDLLYDVKNLEISPVASASPDGTQPDKKLTYAITWKPLSSMMSGNQLATYCQTQSIASEKLEQEQANMVAFYTDLERVMLDIIRQTVSNIPSADVALLPEHLQYYFSWMQLQLRTHRAGYAHEGAMFTGLDLESMCQLLIARKPSWKLMISIVRHHERIAKGIFDPLELMFSTGEAEEFYADIGSHICRKVAPFFTLVAHEQPKQRILEVGAGTGSMTGNLLNIFRAHEKATGARAFSQYTYTDVSSAFFEAAKAKFADFDNDGRMLFQTFDLDRDALDQGFVPHTYDLVIASSVIHATSNIKSTLQNLQRLLKPHGRIVLLEITAPDHIVGSFVFGTLPGWWRGDEAKQASSPAVNEETWDAFLKDSGFSGNETVIRDWEDPRCHDFSLIISSAVEEKNTRGAPTNVIFVISETSEQEALASALAIKLAQEADCKCTIVPFAQVEERKTPHEDVHVFLLDVGQSFLEFLDDINFERIKAILLRTTKLLWICTAPVQDVSYSGKSLSTGLLRSLRSEDVRKHIVTLRIEDEDAGSQKTMVLADIVDVFKKSFQQNSSELEYVIRHNSLCVPRLSYKEQLNDSVYRAITPTPMSDTWEAGPPVKLSVTSPGALESLCFTEDHEHESSLGPQEVEIEAKAWGLSFRDVFLALGRLNEAEGFGFECAGYVRKVGSQCTDYSPGDRVCMVTRGSMRQYPRSDQREIHHIPQDMSFEEAASLIGPAITAVYSLVEIARLRRGEKVLIHSAAGATGQLAVMLAQSIGAEVFCTVGTDAKRSHMVKHFGIPESRILYSRDATFAQGIRRLTNGYGVDVLLNSLSGDRLIEGWKCMAPYGRFVEIGKVDIMSNQGLPMVGFQRNVTFTAVDFYHTTLHRKDITKDMLAKAMLLVKAGVFTSPNPLHTYPLSKVEEAFRYLQSGQHMGRIILVPREGDIVSKVVRKKPDWKFQTNASYLIVGGFGGLGRAILPWMVKKGARHIVVLSRKGSTTVAAQKIIAELRAKGVQVYAPKCDVSSRDELAAELTMVQSTMPPIKGCINAAMLLQDTFFANMSHSDWSGTVKSKLVSSTNLSALVPRDLDFFILFSSLSGVYGTPGQSNYAAGCASQDALARQRTEQGLKALSIDIGWMRTIGVVAESELYQRVREREADMQQIEEDEFLAVLDICCDPHREIEGADDCQLLLGPVIPSAIRAQGQDPPPILQRPLFSAFDELHRLDKVQALVNAQSSGHSTAMLLERAETEEEKKDIAVKALVEKVARALAIPSGNIDTAKPLFEYGVDSLAALELRNWMVKEFGSEMAVFDIMGGMNFVDIASSLIAH
ncbi:hypothetical protein DM02DRAFT_590921 [Periconia macrospinosa]|uniref:Uncharacterized protein n=1 Tax=Periconia macrospinosa TaxID=97972 RepID=A0A2V1DTJ1_9PLEO|nr:hypothetical protein DM02DRAFT_590921 [Periconia macrospinosa]